MAEKDERIPGFDKTANAGKPDILRAKDIIPGTGMAGGGENFDKVDIPQFNLAEDIMAEQRRLTAGRRKRTSSVNDNYPSIPQRPAEVEPSHRTTDSGETRIEHQARFVPGGIEYREPAITDWNPVIADIVSRDIEQLCGSSRR